MRLLFTRSHRSAPGRYLVHGLSPRHGERYLGVVYRAYDHAWRCGGRRKTYSTRKAAAIALLN